MRKVIVSDVETVRTCLKCGKRLNATPKTYGGRDHTCLDHGEQFDCNTKVVRTELFRGYLHGWYNLADEDGSVPVALVEDPEGHLDTWDVAHVQYETPYTGDHILGDK